MLEFSLLAAEAFGRYAWSTHDELMPLCEELYSHCSHILLSKGWILGHDA